MATGGSETAHRIRVNAGVSNIPKVEDKISETVQESFEEFLETFQVAEDDDEYDPHFEGKFT